jgi:hypothetical protein
VLGKTAAKDRSKPANQRGPTGSPPDKKRELADDAATLMEVDEATPLPPPTPPLPGSEEHPSIEDQEPTTGTEQTETTPITVGKANIPPKETPTYAAVAASPTMPALGTFVSPAHQLAGIFQGATARKHDLFIKVMFPTDTNPKDPVKNARNQLLEYFKMLTTVNATAILYKWDKEKDLAVDACLKPNALPTTLTGLQSYADQFRPNAEGGDCWCSLRVGFNKTRTNSWQSYVDRPR